MLSCKSDLLFFASKQQLLHSYSHNHDETQNNAVVWASHCQYSGCSEQRGRVSGDKCCGGC